MKILARDIVGKNAISMQSGKNLYEVISKDLLSGKEVEIDFSGVELFASPFFNASVGLLLKDITVSEMKERLKIVNLTDIGRHLLNHVISNAVKYYDSQTSTAKALESIKTEKDD